MDNGYGYDEERDRWSRRASEILFPSIAKSVFNTPQSGIIYTWDAPEIDRLDTHYGVDTILNSGRRHTALALRIRSFSYYKNFGDITVRYDSLQTMKKLLEIQKSIARFMFYAWGDTDKPILPSILVDWHVVYMQKLVDLYLNGKISYVGPICNGDRSSRFIGFSVEELNRHGLIYRSKKDLPATQLPLSLTESYYSAGA